MADALTLAASLFATALTHAPPETRTQFPGHDETVVQTRARYAGIALDIVRVVGEREPPAGLSRVDAAALMLALAIGESGLSADVDALDCYRGPGWESRCDHGQAHSIWQTWEPCDSRLECGRAAYHVVRGSLGACRNLEPRYWLSAYGSGRCQPLQGAADRWALYGRIRGQIHAGMRNG